MNLEKAIRIKENYLNIHSSELEGERLEADKLGIEALKAYQKAQANGWYPPGYKLPGETKE